MQRISMNIKQFLKQHKFRLYFICLFAFLIIDPLETPDWVDQLMVWGLMLIFFISPYLMSLRFKSLILALIFYCIFMIDVMLEVNHSHHRLEAILSLAVMCYYFGVIVYLLWYTLREAVVSDDLIFSGLTGFFMIGLGFAYIFGTLEQFGLISYYTQAGKVERLIDGDLIYFSLSNLSALGIGDITCATPLGKRLTALESCVGTLYVAVFIGRLVGLSANILNPKTRMPKDKIKKI